MMFAFIFVILVLQQCYQAHEVSSDLPPACNLPMVVGPCKALVRRFYYDVPTKSCRMFESGGCGANGNNFPTMGRCEKHCRIKKANVNICFLPRDIGPCRALLWRYYFDSKTQTCKKFGFGGCKGNANNFPTESICLEHCLKNHNEIKSNSQ